jgi:flagellar M-ring protein FliF
MDETLTLSGPVAPKPRLQDLPYVKQIALLFGLSAAVALGLYMFFWTQSPSYMPLYAGLEEKDALEVIDALRAANIEYKMDPTTGAITVPEAVVRDARLQLAAKGLPSGSRQGLEMIQQDQGFGASQFVESARYQIALETELARTIGSLRSVRAARVHLALPKASAFTTQRDPATASILVELYNGRSLDPSQVAAIVHLVASSIPELSPEKVTVIDQSGRLLTRKDDDGDVEMAAKQFEQQRRFEEKYVDRIEQLLLPLTGPGRVSARVSVDMDFSVTEEAREVFAPETKLRSEQTSEAVTENKGAQGVPGATSNQPPTAENQNAATTANPSNASRNATRNYEIDRTVSHTKQPAGRINRVSVAVLVDHIPVLAEAIADAAKPADAAKADDKKKAAKAKDPPKEDVAAKPPVQTFRALTAEELVQVEKLVREAVGFDEKRGDTVSVMNAPFARVEPLAIVEEPIWKRPEMREYTRLGLGTLVVLFLVFGVLRPLLRNLTSPPRVEAELLAADERDNLTEEERAALEGPEGSNSDGEGRELVPLTEHEQRMAAIRNAAQSDPRRVAVVIKSWVNQNA